MRPIETIVPLGGAARDDIRVLCSDSEVSDDDSSSGGGGGGGRLGRLRTRPVRVLCGWMILIGLYLIMFRTCWCPSVLRRSVCLI